MPLRRFVPGAAWLLAGRCPQHRLTQGESPRAPATLYQDG